MPIELIFAWLSANVPNIPVYVACIIGIVLAASRYTSNPRHGRLVIITLSLQIFLYLLNSFVNLAFPYIFANSRGSFESFIIMWSLFNGFAGAVLWSLLLWSIFGWRSNGGVRQPGFYENVQQPQVQPVSRERSGSEQYGSNRDMQ